MSAETKAALEEAITAHLADEMDGSMMTGYELVIAGWPPEKPNHTTYYYETPDDQPFHVSIGLIKMAGWRLEQRYMGPDDDE